YSDVLLRPGYRFLDKHVMLSVEQPSRLQTVCSSLQFALLTNQRDLLPRGAVSRLDELRRIKSLIQFLPCPDDHGLRLRDVKLVAQLRKLRLVLNTIDSRKRGRCDSHQWPQ